MGEAGDGYIVIASRERRLTQKSSVSLEQSHDTILIEYVTLFIFMRNTIPDCGTFVVERYVMPWNSYSV